MIQLIVSVLLYLVIFFSIAFILNMLIRSTWLMAILYPIVIMPFVAENRYLDYITQPKIAFSELGTQISQLQVVDVILLLSGFAGAIIAGVVARILRRMGYQMF